MWVYAYRQKMFDATTVDENKGHAAAVADLML
jgi:hypothetical protein